MTFIKKNKFKIITSLVILILLTIIFIGIKELIFPNNNKDLYGNRLDGIEEVLVTDVRLNDLIAEIKEEEFVENVKSNIQGRLVNVIVTVEPNADEIKAKALSEKFVSNFSSEELEYYDFQFFLVSDEEDERYPFIGYKHKTSLNFKWSNN